MKRLHVVVLSFFVLTVCNAQTITPQQYIQQYKDIAIREMKRMGVPAAITLAQGILETESGNSVLVKKSNNHFGIKCKSTWTATGVSHDDDALGECFRQYKTAEDSYRDHSNFLRGGDRYAFLFKLDPKDYKGWAYGLKQAGYATNPSYPQIVIRNIEQYNLQQYTLVAVDEVPKFDASKYVDDKEPVDVVAEKTPVEENSNQTMLDAPDKVISINGSKCVLGKKGTSLLVIATKNNIPLSKLLEMNELAEDGMLGKDQYIYLQKKSKTGEKDFVITQYGESLYDVAQKNGIQLQYLLNYNKLSGDAKPVAGTKLILKPGVNIKTASLPQTHLVQPKEGLYAISKKYNITVAQLKEWNNLSSDSLSIGQQLIISKQ